MSDTLSPILRDLYLARYRACLTEAGAIAAALGLPPRLTEAEWRRRDTNTSAPAAVAVVFVNDKGAP